MTDLEQYRPSGIVPIEHDLDDLMRKANVLAKSGLVRKALADKPEAIVAVALRGGELGVSLMTALDEIDVIEGKTYLSAQLCSSLSRAAGHEIEVVETNRDRCVIRGRRREARSRPDAWQVFTWDRERAREAELLAVWVEAWRRGEGEDRARRYVYVAGDDRGIDDVKVAAAPAWAKQLIDAGQFRRKENWAKHPVEMLRARATRELCRVVFGDVLSGLDIADDEHADHLDAPEEAGPITDDEIAAERARDDQVADGEIVEEPSHVDDERVAPDVGHDASPGPGDAGTVHPGAEALTWSEAEWSERLRSSGVVPAKALKAARLAAVNLNVLPPMALAEIDDERVAAAALDLAADG